MVQAQVSSDTGSESARVELSRVTWNDTCCVFKNAWTPQRFARRSGECNTADSVIKAVKKWLKTLKWGGAKDVIS